MFREKTISNEFSLKPYLKKRNLLKKNYLFLVAELWLNNNVFFFSLFLDEFLFNSRIGETYKMNFWIKIKILKFFRLPINFPFV